MIFAHIVPIFVPAHCPLNPGRVPAQMERLLWRRTYFLIRLSVSVLCVLRQKSTIVRLTS